MSESEEPNLFLRKETESEEYDDKWDDTELIAAYDKAVSAVKRQITRKIQKDLGLKDEDVEEFLSDAGTSSSKSNKKGKWKNKKKKSGRGKWAVGSSCRAVYSEDGEEYEAIIVQIIDSRWCLVRFVGYENEEEVKLEDLTQSLGKNVVQMQIEAANQQEKEDMSDEVQQDQYEIPKVEGRRRISTEEIARHVEKHRKTVEPMIKRLPMSYPIPPPPPAPPTMMQKDLNRKVDDLNSMLMSWYMCGYYTGLYERGQKPE